MKPALCTTVFFLATLFANHALAADLPHEKIEEKAKTCAACHGVDGNAATDAQYPRLAGQYKDYIAKALHEYQSGERVNAIMKGFASTLSEDEVNGLAEYYSELPGKIDDLNHRQ
jgi:cytochrome c553